MTAPFYVPPEQLIKDRAEFARKGIKRGRPIAVVEYALGQKCADHIFPSASSDPGREACDERVVIRKSASMCRKFFRVSPVVCFEHAAQPTPLFVAGDRDRDAFRLGVGFEDALGSGVGHRIGGSTE